MKIIFFGSDIFACPSLKKLSNAPHNLLAVVTQPDKPAGRGQKTTACPAARLALELKLKLVQPETLKDKKTLETLSALRPDVLVVVAYGKFLPQSLIGACPKRAVNLHPSLLPKYRGAAPIPWAILNGDKKTGVTTMAISEEMDAGDIYLQCETTIDEAETAVHLENRLSELGADLLLKTLEAMEKGRLKPRPQDSSKIVLAPKLKKEDGHLDFSQPAEKLYNRVRALNPWPGTFCYLNKKMLKVWEAAPVKMQSQKPPGAVIENREGLIVACGQGAFCLLEVQLEGKKKMSAKEFLKGHPVEMGTEFK
ncbi:MAG: methionyl-tRNA formyltransferase [Deltaproteobacteria bacterium]|nr:methionyl-tRNA formyltransferase [Deltaproteobacteria bacterium]MBI4223454.1 methionyl-tRNA formyltransferase [Deltaproteobacteria bacterium]